MKACPPTRLVITCLVIFLGLWALASARHALLQSNAYDLGLFDQWVWLASQGLPPYSSMEGVHLLADHGAWALYLAALPYKLHASVQWLLATQAAGLSFTSIPLWILGRKKGLKPTLCWLICALWWLQPVVFNANLFDFHPEVWVMPVLAGCYWASTTRKALLWFVFLLLLLGCRDGLVLVVAGLGLEQAFRKRWIWAGAAIGLALGWLAMLNRWLYPWLKESQEGPKAAGKLFAYLGNSVEEIIFNLITKPQLLIEHVDWIGGLIYLLLISIAVIPLWRRVSIPVLIGGLPLVMVNLLSQDSPQRTLIHHYNLPIAVIAVVAAIEGLALRPNQPFPWRMLTWATICWITFAKPWFFTGPYLERLDALPPTQQAIANVPRDSRIITTSYLAPHLSQRVEIKFPRSKGKVLDLANFDVLLLNPKDPGWGSNKEQQRNLLTQAKQAAWTCKKWSNGLELCKR